MEDFDLLQLCHDQAHDAAHDFEDTVFVSLTRRDMWLLCFSLLIVSYSVGCLDKESEELRSRIAELVEVQKDHWRG